MAWTQREALEALRGSDLLALGMEADRMRCTMHPENVVTYALAPPAGLALEAAAEQAHAQASDAVMLSALQGFAQLTLEQVASSMLLLHRATPSLIFCHLPAALLLAEEPEPALERLHTAGLGSILLELPQEQAAATHTESLLRAAGTHSIGVVAAYTMGRGESAEERIADLQSIQWLQQNTHALQAISLRIDHAGRREQEATAVDYLKTLAVARLLLHSIPHVTAEWEAMGPKVMELALRFGADDAGSVAWSQDSSSSPSHHGGEAEVRRIIRDAGFHPVERDALFRQSLLH